MRASLTIALAAVLAFGTAASTQAELIAYWNFNSNDLPGGGFGYLADPDVFPLAADDGVGNATLTVGGGILSETMTVNNNADTVYRWIRSFAGSTINALDGDPAGGSLSIEGGTGTANNGAFVQFAFDMTGYRNLEISYATRGTSAGFSSHTWYWSKNGTDFFDFASVSGTTATTFFLASFDPISFLDDASTAFLRLTLDGATAATGNNRLDNIQFNAQAIPEPASISLVALGLSGVWIRRRSVFAV